VGTDLFLYFPERLSFVPGMWESVGGGERQSEDRWLMLMIRCSMRDLRLEPGPRNGPRGKQKLCVGSLFFHFFRGREVSGCVGG